MNLQDTELHEADMPAGFVRRGVNVGEALGRELIGCALYEVHPGEQLWPYHYHLGNEEWAIVVVGEPMVRTPEGERELRPGEVVAFPEGEDGAHTFLNRTEEPARRDLLDAESPDAAGLPGQRQARRRRTRVPTRGRSRLLGRGGVARLAAL